MRAAGRQLELGSHLLVGPERSMRAMPRTAIGIEVRIRGLCQRAMCIPALGGRSGVVDRRTKKRMTKRDSCTNSNQVGFLRRRTRLDRNAEPGSGSPEKHGIADRFGCGNQQQALRLRGEPVDLAAEAPF